jgi:hypothetical protein
LLYDEPTAREYLAKQRFLVGLGMPGHLVQAAVTKALPFSLYPMLEHLTQMHVTLSLERRSPVDDIADQLCRLPGLDSLTVDWDRPQNIPVRMFQNQYPNQLRHLDLSKNVLPRDELAALTGLVGLTLTDYQLHSNAFVAHPSLIELSMRIYSHTGTVLPDGLPTFSHLRSLRRLTLRNADLGERFFRALPHLPLRFLSLTRCELSTPLASLAALTSLTCLELERADVSELSNNGTDFVAEVLALPQLEALTLRDCTIVATGPLPPARAPLTRLELADEGPRDLRGHWLGFLRDWILDWDAIRSLELGNLCLPPAAGPRLSSLVELALEGYGRKDEYLLEQRPIANGCACNTGTQRWRGSLTTMSHSLSLGPSPVLRWMGARVISEATGRRCIASTNSLGCASFVSVAANPITSFLTTSPSSIC